MKLKRLEIELEKVIGFESSIPMLEQYKTPASIAASLCHMAYLFGDIQDKNILDLGCGTGILSIGAALLNAKKVYGIDCDENAIRIAYLNSKYLKKIKFMCFDVMNIDANLFENEKIDTVIMNPPFGSQNKYADRPFLEKALEFGNIIYTIHNKGSFKFIKRFISPSIITNAFCCKFMIPHTFFFHKEDTKNIDVEIYRIKNNKWNNKI